MDNLGNFSNINDEFRSKIVTKIDSIIENISLSRNIEKSIYNSIISESKKKHIQRSWKNQKFKKLYLSKIISIYSNLKSDSYIGNKDFLIKIKDRVIDIDNIGNISSIDIYPERWTELINKKVKQDQKLNDYKPEAMTDIFKCRKCGSRQCSYYEVQTRSADEPMTQFITCLKCNTRWRQ